MAAKKVYPNAMLLIHSECRTEVLTHADYIGSTAGIIDTALKSEAAEFIIGTENGVAERLKNFIPYKQFHPLTNHFICPNMKKTQLSDVQNALENNEFEIMPDDTEIKAARISLERMINTK